MSNYLKLSSFQISVLVIILLSAFLRFYNLPNSFVFAGDEEHQAILAQTIVKDFHIIWIGVNAAHLGFYLGPYWAYFTAFWLWLSNGNPLITGYIAAGIGVLTNLLVILVGSSLFRRKAGLLGGLLWATSPLITFSDQRYWNPSLIPALSLLLLLSLSKLSKNPKWLIVFAGATGFIFHTHLSLVPIICIGIFWLIKKKIKVSKKIIFLSFLTFLFMLAPLLFFDFFHKGTNITTPLRFKEISSSPENRVNPAHHFTALFQTLGRIWHLKPISNNSDELIISCASSSRKNTPANLDQISTRFNPPFFLSLIGVSLPLLFLINKSTWRKDSSALLALFILSISGSFLLFPGGAYEYYLLGIFPLILFLPAILLEYYTQFKNLILVAALLSSTLGVYTIITNNPEFGLGVKNSLIKQVISAIGDEPFELKQTGICHFYEAWRYLFILNAKLPERSDSDTGLGWLYPQEITQNKTKYTVIMSESRVPIDFDSKNAKIIKQGGFTAYIFQN